MSTVNSKCLLATVAGLVVIFPVFPKQTAVMSFTARTFLAPVHQAYATDRLYNVKELGAKGDGVSDDTAAIQRVINAAPDGATIYFPVGTYVVANLQVKNRTGLSFMGEERTSVIKQRSGASRIATFTGVRDIVITKLAFDANGISAFGGVMFYASQRVRIENNAFVDSAPKHNRAGDHYAFAFGKGAQPSQDIAIINNFIDYLQLEVDHARNVLIEGNTVQRTIGTSGIGIFTVGNDAIAEDYLITGNKVIDPPHAAFHAVLDPPHSRNCVFRRIAIVNNTIVRHKTAGYGIEIGTLNNSQATQGSVFEDITVKDNLIRLESTAPKSRQIIFANASQVTGIVFQRLTVTGNTIENLGPESNEFAIDLRRIQNSVVADNTIKGVAQGISLAGALLANQVYNNTVHASAVAYRLDGSLGENRMMSNQVIGNPRERLKSSNLKSSDAVERN